MKAPIEPFFTQRGVEVHVKRDDLVHPLISGNKWYKLKYNITKMRDTGLDVALTFGGAFSNHIAALAAAGHEQGFRTIGVIRGEELHPASNPTLERAAAHGMKLHFVSREDYRRRADRDFLDELRGDLGPFYHIPEGGANYLGVMGAMEMVDDRFNAYDGVICSAGTGTMAAGIALALKAQKPLHVYPAVAGIDWQAQLSSWMMQVLWDDTAVEEYLAAIQVFPEVLGGKYGPVSVEHAAAVAGLEEVSGLMLDPVYTGKAAVALQQNIEQGRYSEGSSWLFIHSGGLQSRLAHQP